jgi:hypothetical protein
MTGELDAQGTHAAITKQVLLFVLLAEILAAAGHEGPPHRPFGRPRSDRRRGGRRTYRESLAGRRPRG